MKSTRSALIALLLCASAFALAGCGTTSDSVTNPDLDNAPPAAPSSVQIAHDPLINADDLVWDASSSPNVNGYEIHRYSASPSGNTAGDEVILVGAEETSLRLPLVASDRTEFYRVRARAANDLTSAYSGSAQANRIGYQGGDIGRDRDGGDRGTDGVE